MMLIMAPMMIGLSFPIRFMISGVTAAKTRNIIMKGSCTFAASTASPPNPKGTGLLTNCTIAGYAMNIVIPLAINMMYEGRRVLSFSNLRSTNGDAIFLSMMTKTDNEITETVNAAPICGKVSEFIPVSRSVNAIRKAIIVVESASAPFKSMEGDACFLPVLSRVLTGASNCPLFSFTNFAITIVTVAANGTMEKKVKCHPKLWMMVAPAKRPTTEPAEYIDPNTPTAIASLAGGNVSLSKLKAAGTAAKPTPWIILLANRNDMLSANPPAIIPAV